MRCSLSQRCFAIGGVLLDSLFRLYGPLSPLSNSINMFIVMIGGGSAQAGATSRANLAALFGSHDDGVIHISPVLYVIGRTNPGPILSRGDGGGDFWRPYGLCLSRSATSAFCGMVTRSA